MSTLSSIPPHSKGLTTSSITRTFAVTAPQQLAPPVGPVHASVEILGGPLQGMEGSVSGQITKSRRGKLRINSSTWETGTVTMPGYQVSIGSINLFISKPKPKIAPKVSSSKASRQEDIWHHVFVGFVRESSEQEHSEKIPDYEDKEDAS